MIPLRGLLGGATEKHLPYHSNLNPDNATGISDWESKRAKLAIGGTALLSNQSDTNQ